MPFLIDLLANKLPECPISPLGIITFKACVAGNDFFPFVRMHSVSRDVMLSPLSLVYVGCLLYVQTTFYCVYLHSVSCLCMLSRAYVCCLVSMYVVWCLCMLSGVL